jgi:hypothetical protein
MRVCILVISMSSSENFKVGEVTTDASLLKGVSSATKSISERLSISFLNARDRDFGEKLPPPASLNGYLNIAIFYFGFFASQK